MKSIKNFTRFLQASSVELCFVPVNHRFQKSSKSVLQQHWPNSKQQSSSTHHDKPISTIRSTCAIPAPLKTESLSFAIQDSSFPLLAFYV